ncbi:MAG TPA: FtsX-like permease family protein [Nocardioidaceae bacterium]|nr:FtsX-like permease family protein [Nocardioidaceae bacterium]
MWTATVRSMFAHKLRLALTTLSIALGIAFLSGTFILGDTTSKAFDEVFTKVSSGTDAVVREEAAYTQSEGAGTSRAPIDASVLNQVRTVDGVRVAEGMSSGYALLVDADGDAVEPSGGAPAMGYSMALDESLRGEVRILDGAAPAGPGEVAIDATSAEDSDIAVGSTIKVLFNGPTEEFTVVGTVGYGDEKNLGGSTSAYFDPATAQRVVGTPGAFDQIDVKADDGVSDTALASRLDAAAPQGAEAVTGQTVADEASDSVAEDLKFLNILLGIFAGIALFVGSFIIWNTFTMTVTQRSREIALTRAVGATRWQVLRSLLTEALLLGAVASAIGIALGVAVAKGLTALMGALNFSMPSTSLQVLPRTIWICLLIGIVVTTVAALVPARRATKVLPVEALREAVPGTYRPSVRRTITGLAFIGLGVAGLLLGLYGDAPFIVFGVGILALIVGVIVSTPLVARPLASAIGAPLRWRGVSGELAQQNAMRNPRRTAATASALMIGLALVISMGVFASSLKASFGDLLDDSTDADLYITTTNAQAEGFSPEATRAAAQVEGVEALSPNGWGEARFDGSNSAYTAIDPATVEQVLNLEMSTGSAADLGPDGILISKDISESNNWAIDDTVPVEFAATGKDDLKVAGIFDATGGFAEGDYLLSIAGQTAHAGVQLTTTTLVIVADGADQDEVQSGIDAALADHPDAKVVDQQGYEDQVGGTVDNLLALVTVMLLLAVIIALLGIVNTLALSVFERTRELGLLRAVGMTGGQVRAMVRWESAVISLMGALIGAALGIGLGMALAQALKDEGIKAISVPVPQVVLYIVLAALAGILAAIGPARTAARVDVLRAVVTE